MANSKARYEGQGRVRFSPDARKRLRPDGKEWHRGDTREDGLRFGCYFKDRDCDDEGFFKEYWLDSSQWERYIAKGRRAQEKRYRQGRALILEVKEKGCVDCGYNKHPAALDFDHRPGVDKKFELALGANRSLKAIQQEIAKCDVVCANCHRIRTVNRQASSGRSPSSMA